MLYKILRPITRQILQGYYQKIYVDGLENIPENQPVILAVNHPSGFTEPCVLATHLERELYFLMRGDVINDRIKWFFEATNQVPIYRFRDGFSSMRQNEKQFSLCFDVLKNNGCITIFAEGTTKHIKHTRPIQKGAARIAVGAMENRDLEDVWIVPVGVNFESSPRARSAIGVQIGKPLSTRAVMMEYKGDERKALETMTRNIYKGLKPLMVHIEQKERFKNADDLLDFRSHEIPHRPWPVAEYKDLHYFPRMKEMADAINRLSSERWKNLEEDLQIYKRKLREDQIPDIALADPPVSYYILVAGAPFALIGGLFLYPVKKIVYSIQKRLNREAEYVSGFRLAGFLLFIPIFILIWMGIGFRWIGGWVFLFILLLPVLSHVSVLWLDQWRRWLELRKWKRLSASKKDDLVSWRKKVMGYFQED